MIKAIFIILTLAVIFAFVDILSGYSLQSTARVVDKSFQDSRTYITTTTTTDGKGSSHTHPVVHYDPAEWSLIVRLNSGNIVRMTCSSRVYYSTKFDSEVPIKTRYGGITKAPYFLSVLN